MKKTSNAPIIEFRRSRIYDAQWIRPKEFEKPPLRKDWLSRERRLRLLWARHGSQILRLMSQITKLRWQEEKIIVYLTWGVKPFSDPVTISLRKDVQSVFETVTHELIHRICSEEKNWLSLKKRWQRFVADFPKESPIAIHHVPIHAVHGMLWKKLFPKRVKALRQDLKLRPYVRSWELVDRITAEKVIEKVFKK